jgi:aryl-alcohol dehydrogenase-like predicted oxidoreductase
VIATKFGFVRDPNNPASREICGRPDYIRQACDASLRRLGTDMIDLYYQHRVDPQVPIEDSVGEMSRLVESGKVRFLGLSEAGPISLRKAMQVHPITAVQTEFSLWSRDVEADVIPACRELGVGFVPYSPLGRGFLCGEIKSLDDLPAEDTRRNMPRFQGENFANNLQLVEKVREIARRYGCTASQLALAWVYAQAPECVPIPGTKRRSYLEENVAAMDIKIAPADLQQIDEVFSPGVVSGERYGEYMMSRIAQ